jgi:hypothetical protein
VRERGTFYFSPLTITQDQLSVTALHAAVRDQFETENHVPRFRDIPEQYRRNWLGADGHLHVYRVYPYNLNQREALYGDSALTTDDKVRDAVVSRGNLNGCPKFEAVLV